MSDKSKKKHDNPSEEPKKRGHYDKPLQVKGDFMDFMNTVIKDAKKKDKVKSAQNDSNTK